MPAPQVSVIIPLYNKHRTIHRAIASVLAQTWRDLELIIVDDGSTDGSANVAQDHDDPRIRIIRQANAGPGAARNRGATESRAEFIAFLDADDEWLPSFLAKSIESLQQYPDCGLSCTARVFYPENVIKLPTADMKTGPWRMPPNLSGYEARNAIHFLHPSAVLCRREVFARYGGFYERQCTYGEDTYLFAQLAFNENTYRIRQPLVGFHQEDSDLSSGRRTSHPTPPLITDPDPVRTRCLASHQDALSNFFTYYAYRAARDSALRGDTDAALHILSRFPKPPESDGQSKRYLREATILVRLRSIIRYWPARKAHRLASRLFPAKDQQFCIPSH